MQKFHNILFVSYGITNETDILKQALRLAHNNKANLKVLIVCPEFPTSMTAYKNKYEGSLREQVQESIQSVRDVLKINEADLAIEIEVQSGSTPAISVIQTVLRGAYDLVIKKAETQEDGKGFKAMDMDLLRKCPCPIWLSQPIIQEQANIRVAVAIDPDSIEPAGHDLSLNLLEISRMLADDCNGELNIISCWDYPFEEYLRNNIRANIPNEQILKAVMDTQTIHRAALEKLIQKSKIGGKIEVHHVRGQADEAISKVIDERNIDILVMGTVARTGIPGFIIGNTAENILQKLKCSLVAMKPHGFVSPIKAY